MFTRIDVSNPFYLRNNFDFSSSSDSESDCETMTEQGSAQKAGSLIHHALKDFFTVNPIPQTFFDSNWKTIEILFAADAALWKAYKDAVTAYSNDDTIEARIVKATAIGNAATAIRDSNADTKATIIRTHNPSVEIANLSIDEIAKLKELHVLVLAKMTGEGKKRKCCSSR